MKEKLGYEPCFFGHPLKVEEEIATRDKESEEDDEKQKY